jgi:polysaccharide biosynthesis transport protein
MRLERRDILSNISRVQPASASDAPTGIDLLQVVDFLRRRWKLIALCGAVMLALAYAFVQTRVPLYASSTEMLLQSRSDKSLSRIVSKDSDSNGVDPGELENQVVLIESVAMLRRVVERENLVQDPEFGMGKPSWLSQVIQTVTSKITALWSPPAPAGVPVEPDSAFDPVTNTARVLRGAVSATRSGKSSALLITVMSQNPKKAAHLANAVALAYVDEQAAFRAEGARNGANWLNESLSNLRTQLKASEEAVAKFKAQNNLTASRANGATVTEQQLTDLNARLVAAQTDTAEKRAKLDQADQVRQNKGNAQTIPDVLRSGVISGLRAQQADISRKEADLVARYGPQHPAVVNVRAERRDIEQAIMAESGRIMQVLKNDYDVALSRQKAIEDSLRQVTGQTNVDDQISVRLRELERTAAANKTLYEDFLSRAKLLEEQTSFTPTEARILTQAVPSGAPAYPRKGITLVLGLFLGLGTGLASAVAMEFLNSGFTSPRQVEEALDLPVLACLARLGPGKAPKDQPPAFLVLEKPLSRYSEAIRSLRNAVALHTGKTPPKVVQVTSTMPQEGKSTVALSMALSAADSGQRVMLIDADLRRPSVTDSFALGSHPGLTDVLAGKVRISEAVYSDPRSGLQVLPAGGRTTNPPALLGSEAMRSLVEGLGRHLDLVIIDTPPLGPVVDGVIVAQLAEAIVYVAKWGETPREAVENSLHALPDARNVAGLVLNLVDEAKIAKFGKYAFYGYAEFAKYYQD